ncbi:MAG: hypothetical protein AB7I27_08085 [Bacteriovoracaceae bacterium]
MKTTSNKNSLFHRIGDKIERLGEMLNKSGANKLGKKVYNMGNKIEHMKEKK